MYLDKINHRYLFFAALLAITMACVLFIERYNVVGGELLVNPNFTQGLAAWRATGASGRVKQAEETLQLSLHEQNRSVRLFQVVSGLGDSGFVRLAGDIKVRDVHAGLKNWHRARLVLSRYGADGKWLPLPNAVVSLDGSADWQHYAWIFKLVKGVARTEVVVQMLRATGDMWVRHLSLQRVAPAPAYKLAGLVLLLVWAGAAFMLFRPYLAGVGRRRHWLLLVALAAILLGTLLPASFKVKMQGEIKQAVNSEIRHVPAATIAGSGKSEQIYLFGKVEIGKAGHFLLFAVLFVLLAKTAPAGLAALPLLDIAILAGATELLQNFVEGRSPLCQDVLIDLGGAFIGWLILFLLARRGAGQTLKKHAGIEI